MAVDRDLNTIASMAKYCENIIATVARFGRDYQIFKKDNVYQSAIAFSLIQIGELANILSPEFKSSYQEIPWTSFRAFRNRVVHHYGSVDLSLIYHIATEEIEQIFVFCQKYLNTNKGA